MQTKPSASAQHRFATGVGSSPCSEGPPERLPTAPATDEPLYIVEVDDQRLRELAGHVGCRYVSPPQPAGQAIALVSALLSCPAAAATIDHAPWQRAIAGGRRTIRLHRATPDRSPPPG
jgi:hypothetical protein